MIAKPATSAGGLGVSGFVGRAAVPGEPPELRHRQEYEAVIDEALRDSFTHLTRAWTHFSAAIADPALRERFAGGISAAHEVLSGLGVETRAQARADATVREVNAVESGRDGK